MDPNQTQNQNLDNPTPPSGNVPPPPNIPTPPAPQGGPGIPPQSTGPVENKQNGKLILFLVISILLLIVLGVIYFMATQLGNQNKVGTITPTPTVAQPTSTPTPTPLSEEDIDTIDLGNPEADLKNIEDDVNQL